MTKITDYGWDETFDNSFNLYKTEGLIPARVIMRNRDYYKLACDSGIITAKLSGRYAYSSKLDGTVPVVGDWVAIRLGNGTSDAMIQGMVDRRSCFSRKVKGVSTVEQTIAANIDTVFIVNGLDGNFNINRIERYLTVAFSSGANPVILLNKADLCENANDYVKRVATIALDIPVHCISVVSGTGVEELKQYMKPGKTLAFLGSSGVGKSTIVNFMFNEERQSTQSTSEYNGKGRHTTTCAELLSHESGCMLIDTPGLRELRAWCDEAAVEESFEDVLLLAGRCRFSNCRHETEPGCAIKDALQSGRLSPERYTNYKKLHLEAEQLDSRKKQKQLYMAKTMKREKQQIESERRR